MGKILELRAYMSKIYARYSRYIDIALKFILALLTFSLVNNNIGYLEAISNPAMTVGLAIICTFLPQSMTAVLAAFIILMQFLMLAPGVAVVAALLMLMMFALYFRYTSGKALILLLTPISFTFHMPVLIPIIFGLVGGPICAIPIAFGVLVYHLVTYAKSYATVIETVAETGVMEQITAFAEQYFANKEMWMLIISFTICILFVYNIRSLEVDYAREIAVVAGVLVNLIMMTFGYVMMDINVQYGELIIGSIVALLIAILLKTFALSVDYSRSEHLQFEDDEYYYYVKAVPKVSMAVPEKTVKTINVRQQTEIIDVDSVNQALEKTEKKAIDIEESEIQKIIEQELNR